MTVKMREETWSIIDQFFKQTPHAFQKLPTIRDTILQAAKDSEERGEERGIQIGEERGQRRAEQQTLIRLLQRKFGPLPESVTSEIQATMNFERLEQWLDQVLDANSLQEMGFSVPSQNGQASLNGA